MSDHRDIDNESRVLTLQAAVFRALRDQGLEPELSDTSAGRVPPADTLHQQLSRVAVSSEIVAHLRSTIGLDESERGWVYRVVDAAYRRHEQRQAGAPSQPGGSRMNDKIAGPYLEDIKLPGHRGRPDMAVRDREWLVDPANRRTVAKVWERLIAAPRTLLGNYGFLTTDELEDDGVPEWLVSHWRSIDYAATGERIETIPGGMIAHDLERIGLGLADIEAGTVNTPRPRPRAAPQPRPRRAPPPPPAAEVKSEPVVIRRRGSGGPYAR